MGNLFEKKETPPPNQQNQNTQSNPNQNLNRLNNPLIQSIVEDMSGENQKSNHEDDGFVDLENEDLAIIGGNNNSNNKVENQNIDNNMENKNKFNKHKDKMKNRNNNRNKKRLDINIKNYGTNNIPMGETARNFYPKKNNNNKEEEEEKEISNIKKISKNFHVDNEENENDDIQGERKKPLSKKDINARKKSYNIRENQNAINNELNKSSFNIRNNGKNNEEKNQNNNNSNININLENNNIINDNININNEIEREQISIKNDLNNNLKINNEVNKINNKINNNKNIDYAKLFSDNKIPRKVFLYDNPNIFDLFIIILNNNYYISRYLTKNEEVIKKYIAKCEKTNTYCLIGLLYYINKYLWTASAEDIKSKDELKILYLKFLDCYVQVNCKNQNQDSYLYDTNNLYNIIGFIFQRINEELTNEKKKDVKIQEFKTGNIQLNKFMNNYTKNHISVVSDYFTGFLLEETTCPNCRERMFRYNNNYVPKKEYSDFNFIYLDLRRNINLNNINMNNSFIFNANFNLNNNNQFNKPNNIYTRIEMDFNLTEDSPCEICCFNTKKYIQKQFYSLPNVLTVILQNNNGSFIIDDEINLSKYTHISGNYNYNLIAILCKYNYNDNYISYCFNHRDSDWYYYTSNENSVHKAVTLDLNAIPLVLVYQKAEDKIFKYNKINLNEFNKKKGYLFRFQNQRPPELTLYFGEDATFKDAKKNIENYFKYKISKLMIKGEEGKNEDKLSDIAGNTADKSILVIPERQ